MGKKLEVGSHVQYHLNASPYVVISNDINNKNSKSPILNVAPLTTKISSVGYPMHVYLNKCNYKELSGNSTILIEQVMTIDKENVGKLIDKLTQLDLEVLDYAIKIQFDIK